MILLEFSIGNSSFNSKVESRKLAGALDSCFVLFGTLQRCAPTEPGGNRTRDLTVRKPVSNCCTIYASSRLGISTSSINDLAHYYPPLPCTSYLHTEDMVDPEIHDFPLDDQFTVDFIHQIVQEVNIRKRIAILTPPLTLHKRFCPGFNASNLG